VTRRDFKLPPEALALIEQVRGLEARALTAHETLSAELERVRKAGAKEIADARKTAVEQRRDAERQIARVREMTDEERSNLEQAQAGLSRDRQALEALLESRVRGFEFIAAAWADYEEAKAETLASALEAKSHPAPFAAAGVRSKGKEAAALRRELKRSEWVLRLYEWHFPWLTELREFEEEQSYVAGEDDGETAEASENGQPANPAQQWLSREEYRALSEVERNQRALDRYLRSRKSPWQLGRDYERYVGYLRESAGARVTYQGIFAGLEDLGRDLLAEREGAIEVIQCKRWARRKTIHEKHVFQLFGTVVAARIEYPDHQVTGTFTTTTALSERAHEFARQLDIRVEENVPLEEYPRIKCNVGRGGERIYHLPFDQQYDSTVISPEHGEVWATRTAEAEALGFRRAWRWRSAVGPTTA
jgi:Restriction endonuclease